jgi:hypothetical protein
MSTELDTFFETHPECRFVDVLLPDLCNVIRGKRLGRDDIRKFYQEACRFRAQSWHLMLRVRVLMLVAGVFLMATRM